MSSSVTIAPEDIVRNLERAATDVLVEQNLLEYRDSAGGASVAAITDFVIGGTGQDIPQETASDLDIEVAALSEIRDKAASVISNFRGWVTSAFKNAKDKLHEIALKIIGLAEDLGVTTAYLMGRLQRRLIRFIVEHSITPPITVSEGNNSVTFAPKEVELSYTIKSSLSMGSLDVAGIVSVLKDILNLSRLCTKEKGQCKLTRSNFYERPSYAHAARCHYTDTPTLFDPVSKQDMD